MVRQSFWEVKAGAWNFRGIFTAERDISLLFIKNSFGLRPCSSSVRRLPVGDAIWIAHHEYLNNEHVLDFIVERKKVDDLRSSIRDNRYKDQQLKLLRCGLKRIIYVVEGDPNFSEASESIKTACFTTEILEGFDVHRTSDLVDTLKKYAYLTQAIAHYYTLEQPEEGLQKTGLCPQFDGFIRRCQDLEKMTVSDVFAIQLMQVPELLKRLRSLSLICTQHFYLFPKPMLFWMVIYVRPQEETLRKQSSSFIGARASSWFWVTEVLNGG